MQRFRVLGSLGQGGGGLVEHVFDSVHGREMALKRLVRTSPSHEQALRREHRIVAGLEHPNLLCPLELGQDDRGLYLLSEFMPSEGFVRYCDDSLIRLAGALPQLLAALRYLHERGIAHGDISSENIRVCASGQLFIMDFGLGAIEGAEDAQGGTPGFISPERSEGGASSFSSDQYSLGRLLQAVTVEQSTSALDAAISEMLGPPSLRPSAAELETRVLPSLGSVAVMASQAVNRSSGLVGREALTRLITGELIAGHRLVLCGPSGIGKTALIQEVSEVVRKTDVLPLHANGYQGANTPFGLLDIWLEEAASTFRTVPSHLREVVERLGAQSPAMARWLGADAHALRVRASLRQRLFGRPDQGLRGLVNDAQAILEVSGQRVLLVADDMQWADRDSLAALRILLEGHSIGFLGGARPGADEIIGTRLLQVPPLDDTVLLQLLVGNGLPEERARQIATRSSGLPGVALLAAQFSDDPRPVEAATFDLIRKLQRPERELLAILWVAGRPVATDEVDLAASSSLMRRGLITAHNGSISLHDALRGPIGKAMDQDWLRAAQLRKAMDPASDANTRVSALLAAGNEEGARALAPKAADEAFRQGAFHRSAELYELATRDGANPVLRERYALVLDSAQRHDDASKVWNELARTSTGDKNQEFLLACARSLLSARNISLGKEAIEEALGTPSPAWKTMLRFLRGPQKSHALLRPTSAERALRNASLAGYFNTFEGIRLALDARTSFGSGTEEFGAWADYLLAFYARFAGFPKLAERYQLAAEKWKPEVSNAIVRAFPDFLHSYEKLRTGDYASAIICLDRSIESLHGTPDERSFEALLALSLRTSAVLARQRVPESEAAVARFEAATRDGRDIAIQCHVETTRALVLTWQGRFEEAIALMDRTRDTWPQKPRTLQLILIETYAALPRMLSGDAPRAHSALSAVLKGEHALRFTAYGPIVSAIAAATELAAARAGAPGASVSRAASQALIGIQRPSFANGLARRVLCHVTGRGLSWAELSAKKRDQPIDFALALHAQGLRKAGSAGTRLRSEARAILAQVGASARLLDEAIRLDR